jgi:hypothetical protein
MSKRTEEQAKVRMMFYANEVQRLAKALDESMTREKRFRSMMFLGRVWFLFKPVFCWMRGKK